ncbi:mitochondrial import inner membrane translocase subunit Tim10B [Drosophila pseudoobscura]|uniref:Mitochondrial import inner membrane translocase subunit n=2 Tax=Drosophila pseudoobscura TaxID=7237 RepID=B5DL92_DROPS|nr:mitochondrial import inner membrane translocase subunit Tim10B [Drosophila pseudoobscura]XP_015041179.1 mitochondrial import inner membrane translocase subunit Tim10B [Drosophila pseudoobscura]AFQ31524.1 mitochondrial GA22687 [Drosophila pseudoobscura]
MDPNLRNMKDFLTLYNKVTEMCFNRCVDNFNQRELGGEEDTCVDRCVTKFARFNQNIMKVYVDAQTKINTRRMQEVEENARKLEQQQKEDRQKEEQTQKEASAAGPSVLTPIPPNAPGNLPM